MYRLQGLIYPLITQEAKNAQWNQQVPSWKMLQGFHIFWWNIIGFRIPCYKVSLRVSTTAKWKEDQRVCSLAGPLGIPIA